ncbi:MAG: glycosyltransferase family 39 protein [Actinomycetota bacterium]|nr:glycosyltransferase family 39 protein [Actinomycetota bacterium]
MPIYATPDAIHYEMMAKQLINKGIYGYASESPNAFVTPTYPLFLTLIYWISGYANKAGGPHLFIRIFQAILGAFTLYFTFLLGKRISCEKVGLMAAILLALHPSFLRGPIFLLTESLSTFLFIGYIYYQMVALDKRDKRLFFLTGILFGLAVLSRPSTFIVLIVPFAYSWFTTNREGLVRSFAITLIGFSLIMLPWVARNALILGTPAPFSTHGGDPLLSGVDPYHYELGSEYRHRCPTYKEFIKEEPAGETMTGYAVKAIAKGFKEQPLLYFKWFTWGKFWRMFEAPWVTQDKNMYRSVIFDHYMIVILGWVGVAMSPKAKNLRMISLILLVFTAGLLPFMAETRFVYCIIPLLSLTAAEVIHRAWSFEDV